jgi:hypothetical protein
MKETCAFDEWVEKMFDGEVFATRKIILKIGRQRLGTPGVKTIASLNDIDDITASIA